MGRRFLDRSPVSGWTTQSAGLDTYSNEGVTSSLTDDVWSESYSQPYGNESYWQFTDDVTTTVTYSSWLNGTDGSHTSWVTESSVSTESGSEAGGGFGLGGVTGLPETSTDGSLLAWITREQGEAYPTNEFVLYDSPRTVAAYLSSPTGQLVVAGLGEVLFDDPFDLAFGFVPSTNAMTALGLPAEKLAVRCFTSVRADRTSVSHAYCCEGSRLVKIDPSVESGDLQHRL